MTIPRAGNERLTALLDGYRQANPDTLDLVLSTADGFELASSHHGAADAQACRRMAAMASSVLAIGMAMQTELRSNCCKRLVLEGSESVAVILAVPVRDQTLVLMAVCNREVSLGRTLWSLERFVLVVGRSAVDLYPQLRKESDEQP